MTSIYLIWHILWGRVYRNFALVNSRTTPAGRCHFHSFSLSTLVRLFSGLIFIRYLPTILNFVENRKSYVHVLFFVVKSSLYGQSFSQKSQWKCRCIRDLNLKRYLLLLLLLLLHTTSKKAALKLNYIFVFRPLNRNCSLTISVYLSDGVLYRSGITLLGFECLCLCVQY